MFRRFLRHKVNRDKGLLLIFPKHPLFPRLLRGTFVGNVNFAACQASTTGCETALEAASWASPAEMSGWTVPIPREARCESPDEIRSVNWCPELVGLTLVGVGLTSCPGAILPGYPFDVLPGTTAHARIAP